MAITTTYKHGIYTREVPTSIYPPRKVSAAIPMIVGTAPVHRGAGGVNKLMLFYSYAEAVAALGQSDQSKWADYTLLEAIFVYFQLYNVGPVIVANVFDPSVHKQSVAAEAAQFNAAGAAQLAHDDVLEASVIVKNESGDTTYELDTDYELAPITGVITRISTGAIAAEANVKVDYDYADPSAVTAADIIGGVTVDGEHTGLELIEDAFPMYRLVPSFLLAPKWSTDTAVAAVMAGKVSGINGHFRATALIDLDDTQVTKYSDAPGYKSDNGLTDDRMVVFWGKGALSGASYWLSTHAAALAAQVDAEAGDIPYVSPSNHRLQLDGLTANGKEVTLNCGQAAYLNGQGIITALNWVGGWRLWGNRTACYPSTTDPKDAFWALRRMFDWISNTIILSTWQKVDAPITRRLVDTIRDSINIWFNALQAKEIILGGLVDFLPEENARTDLMDGKLTFHLYVTPPSPAREIEFIMEYDPTYLQNLFGGE